MTSDGSAISGDALIRLEKVRLLNHKVYARTSLLTCGDYPVDFCFTNPRHYSTRPCPVVDPFILCQGVRD